MTHIYANPRSLFHDNERGNTRYVNIWKADDSPELRAGDRHWSRATADRAVSKTDSRWRAVYRVVVKFK